MYGVKHVFNTQTQKFFLQIRYIFMFLNEYILGHKFFFAKYQQPYNVKH